MSRAEEIKNKIETQFPFLKDLVKIPASPAGGQNPRRLWVEVDSSRFFELFDAVVKGLNFYMLPTITGLDEGENLGFIYHLASDGGIILNVHTRVKKDTGSIKTITGYFPGAAIYERELVDLFGAKIEGVPEGVRYPLPDEWPAGQYPLRKDWDKSVLDKMG